jgi:hypothetical protein
MTSISRLVHSRRTRSQILQPSVHYLRALSAKSLEYVIKRLPKLPTYYNRVLLPARTVVELALAILYTTLQ